MKHPNLSSLPLLQPRIVISILVLRIETGPQFASLSAVESGVGIVAMRRLKTIGSSLGRVVQECHLVVLSLASVRCSTACLCLISAWRALLLGADAKHLKLVSRRARENDRLLLIDTTRIGSLNASIHVRAYLMVATRCHICRACRFIEDVGCIGGGWFHALIEDDLGIIKRAVRCVLLCGVALHG